jgi:hypothetical protein
MQNEIATLKHQVAEMHSLRGAQAGVLGYLAIQARTRRRGPDS